MKFTEDCIHWRNKKRNRLKSAHFTFCVFYVAVPVAFNTTVGMRTAGETGIDFGSGFSRLQGTVNFFST